MKKSDFVVRFAGEGGQGVVTSAEGFAQAAAQVGYHVQTFATFPSQILGGPTWTQTRVSTSQVLSSGDELDVLVAFNRYAYDAHKGEVGENGVIVYNTGDFELDPDGHSLGMPFDELAKSTGNARAANMVVMGALAYLVNMPQSILEAFVVKRFTRGRPNDEEIIKSNIQALSLGKDEAVKSGFSLGELAEPQKPEDDQILVNGNVAICLGSYASGLEFFVGYPISPATSILVWMEQRLVGPGRFAYQATSEIESITSVLGAAYSGKKANNAVLGVREPATASVDFRDTYYEKLDKRVEEWMEKVNNMSLQDVNRYQFRRGRSAEPGFPVQKAGSRDLPKPSVDSRLGVGGFRGVTPTSPANPSASQPSYRMGSRRVVTSVGGSKTPSISRNPSSGASRSIVSGASSSTRKSLLPSPNLRKVTPGILPRLGPKKVRVSVK